VLNATALFNHGNVRLPGGLDRVVRWLLVTPDMHRVHHSAAKEQTNSNFAFNLPWWDRMLGTYSAQPRAGHEAMTIGLEYFRGTRDQYLDRLLIQPLVNEERKPEKPVDGESQSHGMKMNG
jgi:sterol desaturase/sphingolipid hydroxylase (fatty acid hydroxylase superfamily)